MTQSELSKKTGIRAATINELYHDIARGISFEQIDRICEVLGCDISQLFEYVPNTIKRTGKSLVLEEHGNRKKAPLTGAFFTRIYSDTRSYKTNKYA